MNMVRNTDSATSPFTHPLSTSLRPVVQFVLDAWGWLVNKRTQQLAGRRMRVAETVSLGEKRFVSIVHVDGAQFLVGGAANQVSLLAILPPASEKAADPAWRPCSTAEVSS